MAVISGTVKDVNGDFARRVVRAYRRSDGAFAAQAVSDATTGAFSCTALDASAHYALTLDGDVTEEFDPYWSNVVLAMHMDDAGLTDLKGHAVTLNGNAARSSAQSKFGGYAAYFDGSGDYLTAPTGADFAFGTGDFTVECWINPVSVAGLKVIYDSRTGSVGSVGGISIAVSSGTLRCDTNVANVLTGGVVTTGAWQHVALSRASGVFKLWLGGSQVATSGAAYTLSDGYMFVGTDKTGAAYFNGYIDDLRITKGVARYTANFTPPSSAFPGGLVPGTPTANALIFDNIIPV